MLSNFSRNDLRARTSTFALQIKYVGLGKPCGLKAKSIFHYLLISCGKLIISTLGLILTFY